MTTPTIADYLKYANLQMAAEALYGFDAIDNGPNLIPGATSPAGPLTVENLTTGNRHASKMTATEVEMSGLTTEWVVVEHKSNTETGFSGTLFFNSSKNEYVMSFRSTEFIDDAARDNQATNKLEIQEKGWALGQIDDMEQWYKSIKGQITGPLTVTGYSLGGHLATAFNLLHPNAAQQVINFNGAGVGVIGDGSLSTTQQELPKMIEEFHKRRADESTGTGLVDVLRSNLGKETYQALRGHLKEHLLGLPDKVLIEILKSKMYMAVFGNGSPDPDVKADFYMLAEALDRIILVANEARRVPDLPSGATKGDDPKNPADIPEWLNGQIAIAAESLDYQIAVLSTIRDFQAKSLSIAGGAINMLGRWDAAAGAPHPNQWDLSATEMDGTTQTFMVSHSQYRYGTEFNLFIENQPLYRGNAISETWSASSISDGIKFLVPEYAKNDFGDTHSLVLILDSLNVQNTLIQLDGTISAQTINGIFQKASNLLAQSDGGTQGKAEGDVLENVVNALADTLGLNWAGSQRLNGNPDGATWSEANDMVGGEISYSGRETFYVKLKEVQTKIKDLGLEGLVKITLSPADGLSAKNDFGVLLSLYYLTPFALKGDDAAILILKSVQQDLANQWEADKGLSENERRKGESNFTDEYLVDRANMLYWLMQRNERNVPPGVTVFNNSIADKWRYEDRSSKTVIDVNPPVDKELPYQHYITFGGNAEDTIDGGDFADRLYGGKNNDIIKGGKGNDYIEGNEAGDVLYGGEGQDTILGGEGIDDLRGEKGNDLLMGGDGEDTYRFKAGDGSDVIIDISGDGSIEIDGGLLSTAKKIADKQWKGKDSNGKDYKFTLIANDSGGNDLIITRDAADNQDFITISNWQEGHLSIQLEEAPAATPVPTDHGLNLVDIDDNGVWYTHSNIDTQSYTLIGTTHNDHITAGAGNDKIEGRGGFDILAGGAGDDQLYHDLPVELETAISLASSTQENAGSLIVIEGGGGNDLAIGGITNYLFGGGGIDTLIGGGGDDVLQGDTYNGGYASGTSGITGVYHTFAYDEEKHKYYYYVRVTSQDTESYYSANGDTAADGDWDVLIGGGGNDVVFGELGDDYISLGEGNDYGVGGDDADIIYGDDGNDKIFGDFGWDTNQPTGNESDAEMAAYDGLPGNYHGSDLLVGGKGDDYIEGNGKDDHLYGGEGKDRLLGDDKISSGEIHGSDYLNGASGNDTLEGGGGDDELLGGVDNDKLFGDDVPSILKGEFHGKDYIDGEDGDDYLEGGGNDDDLNGGIGNDTIWGDSTQDGLEEVYNGRDLLNGEAGDDQLVGGGSDDELLGGAGKDILRGDGDDSLVGGSVHGSDYLSGGAGADELYGDGGDDRLNGGDDNDHLEGDYLTLSGGFHGHDELEGEKGNDTLIGGGGGDTLRGGEGDDELQGDGAYVAEEDQGNDSLDGGTGNDTLAGGGGDDKILGGDGDDELWGEAGDDTLDGGTGADYLDGGEGKDVYLNVDTDDYIYDEDQQFELQFAAGVSVGDIKITTYESDGTKVAELWIGDKFIAETIISDLSNQNLYHFADGSQITQLDLLKERLVDVQDLMGTDGDDSLHGYAGDDILKGLAGNDTLQGRAGSDIIEGGKGDDTLEGGQGGDLLSGGAGNDTYIFKRGDGGDVIVNEGALAGIDVLQFSSDIAQADIAITREANGDLVLKLKDGSGQVVVEGWYNQSHKSIETIQFGDGISLTSSDLEALSIVPVKGTFLDDLLTGSVFSEPIFGFGGSDTIDGGGGNDSLEGGEGFDTYVLKYQMGQDLVVDSSTNGNLIKLAQGLTFGNLDASRNGDDLFVRIMGTQAGMVLQDYFSTQQAWTIQNANGELLDVQQLYTTTQNMEQDAITKIWQNYLGEKQNSLVNHFLVYGFELLDDGTFHKDWSKVYNQTELTAYVNQSTTTTTSYWYYYPEYYGGATVINTNTETSTSWNATTPNLHDQSALINKVTTFSDDSVIQSAPTYSSQNSNSSVFAQVAWAPEGAINWMPNGESTGSKVGYLWGPQGVSAPNIGWFYDEWTMKWRYANVSGTVIGLLTDGSDPEVNEYRPQYVEASLTTSTQTQKIEEIYAGGSNNVIYADYQTLVDGGGGDDSIYGAGLAYGGDGNDTLESGEILLGGIGNDTLIGGKYLMGGVGDDYMDGGSGSSHYSIDANQSGNDTIDEEDSFDQYFSWYYASLGIPEHEANFRNTYGGKWVFYGEGLAVADTYDQAIVLAAQYGLDVTNFVYVEPLPLLPPAIANDYASLQWMFDAGIIDQDIIEFEAGIAPDDVVVKWVNESYVKLSWGDGKSVTARVATASDLLGTGIEVIKFNDGTQWNITTLEQFATSPVEPTVITGTNGADSLNGGVGHDTIHGIDGDDLITGNAGDDNLFGGAGNDVLDGGLGGDNLVGGSGNDTYFVDSLADVVTENANEGVDTVQASISYVLDANLENLILSGMDSINGTGNALDNVLTGNTASNVLKGGAGNDIYIVGVGDKVAELVNHGFDTVVADFTFTLSGNLENLTLGGGSDINGVGNALNNVITGNEGDNVINGGAGADTMAGGTGNDVYMVSSVGDVVVESADEGADTVKSDINYVLGEALERLVLLGTGDLHGTGNALNNFLIGNGAANMLEGGGGNDTLNGGGGTDTLFGGLGNDSYLVNDSGVVIAELADEGIELVKSTTTYILADNVENLALLGAADIDGTGNDINNALTGNAGNNVLSGGVGNDTFNGGGGMDALIGGEGNDIYLISDELASIVENADEGADIVRSSVSYALGADVENLVLTGSVEIYGVGNAFNNILSGNSNNNMLQGYGGNDNLQGNAGNDVLQGGAGNDVVKDAAGNNILDGGSGADRLTGSAGNEFLVGGAGNDIIATGAGNDVIAFNRGDGADIVQASTGMDNTLSVGNGIQYADLLFKKSANDLVLITGAKEQLIFKDWYLDVGNSSIGTLQVIIEGTADYLAGSELQINNKKIQQFDFSGLVAKFDQARTANPSLTGWSLSSSLLEFHLGGSDSTAIGGDLAYQYAKTGNLSSLSMLPAQGLLADTSFGSAAHNLQGIVALQDQSLRLS